jgi:hypothetical protein
VTAELTPGGKVTDLVVGARAVADGVQRGDHAKRLVGSYRVS